MARAHDVAISPYSPLPLGARLLSPLCLSRLSTSRPNNLFDAAVLQSAILVRHDLFSLLFALLDNDFEEEQVRHSVALVWCLEGVSLWNSHIWSILPPL